MKRLINICGATVAAMMLMTGSAHALTFGSNITVYDGESKNEAFYQGSNLGREDNEVEVGNVKAQAWDLEGFFQKNSQLSMIGGFNFKQGNSGYTSGDIFISTDATYGLPIKTYSTKDGYNNVSETFGYEYVLDVDWATLQYDVYRLVAGSSTTTVYFNANETGTATSNPWKYVAGGTEKIGSGVGTGGGLLSQAVYSGEYGLLGSGSDNNHYAVSFDISAVIADANLYGKDFYTHFTMGCGNDNLIGKGAAPVPEPSTLILLGVGIAALGFARRRSAKK